MPALHIVGRTLFERLNGARMDAAKFPDFRGCRLLERAGTDFAETVHKGVDARGHSVYEDIRIDDGWQRYGILGTDTQNKVFDFVTLTGSAGKDNLHHPIQVLLHPAARSFRDVIDDWAVHLRGEEKLLVDFSYAQKAKKPVYF